MAVSWVQGKGRGKEKKKKKEREGEKEREKQVTAPALSLSLWISILTEQGEKMIARGRENLSENERGRKNGSIEHRVYVA